MGLEAVWLKDGKEIYWVNPVIVLQDPNEGIEKIAVYNGFDWYDFDWVCKFIGEIPTKFLVRARAE